MWSSKTKVIERRKEIINGQEVWVKVMAPHAADGNDQGCQRVIFTRPSKSRSPAAQMAAVRIVDKERWKELNTGKKATVPIIGNKRKG